MFFKQKLRFRLFVRMNLKRVVLKNFVFDWALCFRLCEVYHFQNLVGLELPIKHALSYQGVISVIYCKNLITYVPTTVAVAVIVDGFIVGKFWFFAPLGSHGWYRLCSSFGVCLCDSHHQMSTFAEHVGTWYGVDSFPRSPSIKFVMSFLTCLANHKQDCARSRGTSDDVASS